MAGVLSGGEYMLQIDGLDEIKRAMVGVAGGLRDLRSVNERVSHLAAQDVRRRVPIYHGRKPGKRGVLRGEVTAHSTPSTAQVWMSDHSGVLILQEFGGTSFWHTAGAGALRAGNRSHRGLSGVRISGAGRGHVLYKKPRKALGYFIWNVGYRIRYRLTDEYQRGLKAVCDRHGLKVASQTGNLTPEQKPWRRAA